MGLQQMEGKVIGIECIREVANQELCFLYDNMDQLNFLNMYREQQLCGQEAPSASKNLGPGRQYPVGPLPPGTKTDYHVYYFKSN